MAVNNEIGVVQPLREIGVWLFLFFLHIHFARAKGVNRKLCFRVGEISSYINTLLELWVLTESCVSV